MVKLHKFFEEFCENLKICQQIFFVVMLLSDKKLKLYEKSLIKKSNCDKLYSIHKEYARGKPVDHTATYRCGKVLMLVVYGIR